MTHPTGPGGADLDKLELGRLCAWMDAQGLGHGALDAVATLSGGTQNILVQFTRAGQEYVLRRPPRHLRDNSNEAMRREARVLAALAGTSVPHPRLIAACADASVLGAAFTLMEKVDGFNATAGLPKLHAASATIRHSMGLALVDGIAALAGLDYRGLGLDGLGRPENFLARQVPRWRAQLDSYAALQGWPGQARIPGVAAVAAWLEANRPSQFDPGIMHGDYHLANVLYRPDGPALAAIVDWELVTIGDPLLDLGWLLATWPQEGGALEGGALDGGPEHGGPREKTRSKWCRCGPGMGFRPPRNWLRATARIRREMFRPSTGMRCWLASNWELSWKARMRAPVPATRREKRAIRCTRKPCLCSNARYA